MKFLITLLASGKLFKILSTGGTMLLSVFAYSLVFGWMYAAGLVALIFFHEMGHYLAARQKGLDVGAPMFIPFVGAFIALKEKPMDVETEAYVGFGGPFVGTLAALGCYYLAIANESPILLALSYSGFFINLFNLIPISPFDGGRITAILSPRIWLIGVPILIIVFLYRPSPLLILMAIIAAPSIYAALHHNPKDEETAKYYSASLEKRIIYGVYYITLVVFLAVMTNDVHEMLASYR
ncbi:MAG: site-2 protease family protein [Nitrospinota bacterium]|nr:site-2 protease family protein [Nitrospinota bacterium]MDH5677757.1 site-2 protease family protein [Nitrospinota bacterium]MDH5755495.1 site-2 protease family protein [Nitrospinota bacterium]